MSEGATVVVLGQDALRARERILGAAGEERVVFAAGPDELERHLETVRVVAGQVSPAALAKANRLEWVHSWAAGPDRQLYPEMVASPVTLTSSKGNGGVPLAEQALLLMLMLSRDVPRWMAAQAERRWDHYVHPELAGKTVGIIGLGYSGSDLARKAKAFHMRVLGVRRDAARPVEGVDQLFARADLDAFLGESDFVVVTAPRTPETTGMLGEAQFRAMRETAYVVCISRGGIIVDDALLKALDEGWIAGAGLDAHGTEPLPPDSPFWSAPNTIITPHNGASTPQTRARGIDIFVDNLRRFRAGRKLVNVVDKQAGY